MSEREYVKSLIDLIPEEQLGEVIEYLMEHSDRENDEKRFELVAKHILNKYHKAFEELAK